MDTLLVFSVACNVVQVIDFSLKIVSQCKEIVEKGSTTKLTDYNTISSQIQDSLHELDKSLGAAPQPITKTDAKLLTIARKCSQTAQDVQTRLKEIHFKQNRLRSKLDIFRKMFINSRSLEDLHDKLREYEKLLNTQILVQLR